MHQFFLFFFGFSFVVGLSKRRGKTGLLPLDVIIVLLSKQLYKRLLLKVSFHRPRKSRQPRRQLPNKKKAFLALFAPGSSNPATEHYSLLTCNHDSRSDIKVNLSNRFVDFFNVCLKCGQPKTCVMVFQ